MTTILVDSNVILDVAIEDPRWYAWSSASLQAAADSSILVINPLVYAEVSVGFSDTDILDERTSFVESRSPTKQRSSQASASSTTSDEEGSDVLRSPISTSEPTPRWPATCC